MQSEGLRSIILRTTPGITLRSHGSLSCRALPGGLSCRVLLGSSAVGRFAIRSEIEGLDLSEDDWEEFKEMVTINYVEKDYYGNVTSREYLDQLCNTARDGSSDNLHFPKQFTACILHRRGVVQL